MKQIRVIINPAAGKDIPVLSILNDEFGSKVDWDAQITHGPGDAGRLGEKAIAEGVDLVAVYGGDGTVSEVAASLAGRGVEMAILAGGTGNGVARFLELPLGLREAAALLSTDYSLRPLDLGRVNNRNFILRADLGFMEGVDQATTRFSKDHLGKWAYVLTSVRHPSLLTPTHYTLTIDGEDIDVEAVTILIINTGAVQFGHRAFVTGSSPDDGFLDLLVLTRRDALALLEVAGAVFLGTHTPLQHWRAKSVMIRTNSEQPVALDGEIVTSTPAMVEIVPHAVNVVVPRYTGLPVVQGRV